MANDFSRQDDAAAGNDSPWAAHAAANANFSGGTGADDAARQSRATEPRSTKDILAGINPDAMRAVVEESHRGLFGAEQSEPQPAPQTGGFLADEAFGRPHGISSGQLRQGFAAMDAAPAPRTEPQSVTLPASKAALLKQLAQTLEETAARIKEVLAGIEDLQRVHTTAEAPDEQPRTPAEDVKVIEGVFNGQSMIGPDGKQYNIPANYASKSKLVEGDLLKLTILPSGKFIYKQIGPIERDRLVGTLTAATGGNDYFVEKDGRRWRVLHASVTYYKGQPGDEVIILVPKHGESTWAAVENIVSRA